MALTAHLVAVIQIHFLTLVSDGGSHGIDIGSYELGLQHRSLLVFGVRVAHGPKPVNSNGSLRILLRFGPSCGMLGVTARGGADYASGMS